AATILENLGYHTKAVDNGYDAVDFIKKSPADLVILDMIMAPSISGLETYQRIKKINPGQKAIIASGYSESEEVLMAQDLGAGSFVKKPYTILDMGIAVKEELEK
ncbi:MAG: response regulator, partial [Proteobacteria bacterium]|nr:response regulator [Pseudomonadota bacterium]